MSITPSFFSRIVSKSSATLGLLALNLITLPALSYAQNVKLQPGFNAQECEQAFVLNAAYQEKSLAANLNDAGFTLHYESPAVGLDNMAQIWLQTDSIVHITLRGTTPNMSSIMADFYCAMIPAEGEIKLNKDRNFPYKLATDPRAAVHAGFLLGFAFLADDLQEKIAQLYTQGYRNFVISGHSQGGALCYFFSAWLMQQRREGKYSGMLIKTYATAAPKMGNIYFAYDYDNAQLSQWSFSVVNSADAVPEMPFTTQQISIDMNEPNPILDLMQGINGLPWLKRVVLKGAFNKMKKRAEKSSRAYQKYLGNFVGEAVRKSLAEVSLPPAVKTTYFVRPGVPIVLTTNQQYQEFYKDAPKYFDHGIDPYRFLLRQHFENLPEFERIIFTEWK